jgi:outer membrane protein OmpA-like peptidoglycan-associated protein/tetratricopeptide (TPR) repeat protein
MKKVLIALLSLVTITLSAQDDEGVTQKVQKYPNVKAGKKKKLAKQLVKDGSYYNAVSYLQDVVKAKPDNINVIHQLAELNRNLRDYKAAEKYYALEIQKVSDKWPNSTFFLGQMQKMNGKYEDAKKTFQAYLKMKLDKKEISYKSIAKTEIIGCDSSSAWLANPNKMKVEHEEGSVNNILTDFAPKPLSDNRLLYSSLKSDTAINVTKSDQDYYAKIFIATKEGNAWKSDTRLSYPPNDAQTHVGNAILSTDEKIMYFTRCDQSALVSMKCKLYRTKKGGRDWGEPEELKALNNPDGTTTQPAFGTTKDGKEALFFVSDKSGRGGLDIFYAEIKGDGFGPVKNIGNDVNTSGDEFSPYYDKKAKALYFSSNGRPNLGGLDVFKVNGTPDSWSVPMNLGAPVNSSADDIYFVLDDRGKKGYVVSNRVGTKTIRGETCCDDIWSVAINEELVLIGTYALRTDPDKKPVPGVNASFYKVEGKNFDFVGEQTTAEKTPFSLIIKRGDKFKVNGTKEGFWPSVENFAVDENEQKDTIYQVFLIDPIIKNMVKVENIYFAFDKSDVIDFYKLKMDSVFAVLMQNPGYSVEVQGHTDSKGSDEYNIELSERRANEAKAYLVSKGIEEARVIAIGFGEGAPIAPNDVQGEDDPEGRARNRRVEFKLVPDKPEEAPTIEYDPSVPVDDTKTGPGYDKK